MTFFYLRPKGFVLERCKQYYYNRMNHLHERALRTVYNDNLSTFERLHVRILRILATEPYKTKENLAAPIIHETFEQRNIQYNLHSQTDFQFGSVKTVKCCLRAGRYLGPKIWNIVPFEVRSSETLAQLKMKINSVCNF